MKPSWQANDNDSGELPGRISNRVREILVERDQATPFSGADSDDIGIGGGHQLLLGRGGNVDSRSRQESGASLSEVLVKLDLHATPRPDTIARPAATGVGGARARPVAGRHRDRQCANRDAPS